MPHKKALNCLSSLIIFCLAPHRAHAQLCRSATLSLIFSFSKHCNALNVILLRFTWLSGIYFQDQRQLNNSSFSSQVIFISGLFLGEFCNSESIKWRTAKPAVSFILIGPNIILLCCWNALCSVHLLDAITILESQLYLSANLLCTLYCSVFSEHRYCNVWARFLILKSRVNSNTRPLCPY